MLAAAHGPVAVQVWADPGVGPGPGAAGPDELTASIGQWLAQSRQAGPAVESQPGPPAIRLGRRGPGCGPAQYTDAGFSGPRALSGVTAQVPHAR